MNKSIFFWLLFLVWGIGANAQLSSTYTFSQSLGTYTEITGGTVHSTTTSDDQSFNAINIGFNFTYAGTNYTQVSINNNGFIAMGATVATSYVSISGGTTNNVIAANNHDLQGQTGSEVRSEMTGVAPNRVFVIQWKNYRHYGATGDNYNFQIRLNEATQSIDIVYGTFTQNATARTPQVGLRGASNADFMNRETTTDWSVTTAGALNTSTCALSTTIIPVSGLTFSYTIPACVLPSNGPADLVLTPASTSISGTFTPVPDADSYIVLYSTSSTLGAGIWPIDGTIYANGATIGNGTVSGYTSTPSFNITGLTPSTLYYIFIYSNNRNCYGGPIYVWNKPLGGNASTLITDPIAFTATGFDGTTVAFTATPNVANNDIMIIYNQSGIFGIPTGTYIPTDVVAGGGTVYYNGPAAGLTNQTGLNPQTIYYYKAFSVNGTLYSGGIADSAKTKCGNVTAYPHTEGYDLVTWPPECWLATTVVGTNNWTRATAGTYPTCTPYNSSTAMAMYNSYNASSGNEARFASPFFDLTSLTTPQLTFNMYHDDGYDTYTDEGIYLQVSTNGTTWTTLGALYQRTGASNGWVEHIVDLSAYAGQTIKLGFLAHSQYGNNMFLDNVILGEAPSCAKPMNLTAGSIADVSATLSWTAGGTEALWNVEYGIAPFAQGAGTLVNGVSNPFNLAGLTSGTVYQYYVQADCGAGLTSIWNGPYSFTTAVCPLADQCNYILYLIDSYGDGWNGNTLAVNQNGIELGVYTLTGGFGDTILVPLCTSQPIDLIWTTGSFPDETSFSLKTAYDEPVYEVADGSTLTDGIIYTYTSDCTPPACIKPSLVQVSNITSVSVDLSWTQQGANTNWNIEYGAVGFALGTGTTVTASATPNQTISGLTPNSVYECYVQSDCGGSGVSLWEGPITFITFCTAINTLPYTEEFATMLPTTCWNRVKGTLAPTTTIASLTSNWLADGYANSGATGSARLNISGTTLNDWLVSPPIDLGDGSVTYQMEFKLALTASGGTGNPATTGTDDKFAVVISTDGGNTWSNANSLRLWDNAGSTFVYNSLTPAGTKPIISLNGYTGIVRFGFYGESTVWNASNDLFVDSLVIKEQPACVEPQGLAAINVTNNSADFNWLPIGSETSWNIEWGASGFTLGAGTFIYNVTSYPYAVSGLTSSTAYSFYVQARCGLDSSAWVGPFAFTTTCDPATLPFSEGFEGITTANTLPQCWISTNLGTKTLTYITNPGSYNRIPHSGTKYASFYYSCNDYFFSKPVSLEAGHTYKANVWYITDGYGGWTTFALKAGTTANAGGMTINVASVSNATNTTYQELSGTFTPATTGIYYIGVYCVATGAPWYLSFDDLGLIESLPPVADFVASTETPIVDQVVTLTDQTLNEPTSWKWFVEPNSDFDFVNSTSDISQNPQVAFHIAGTWSVALRATNALGFDSLMKVDYITVTTPTTPPDAGFVASNLTPTNVETVILTDTSLNTPTTWAWTFNPNTVTFVDGTDATSQNPHVTFDAAGQYTVELTATNGAGSDVATYTNYINVIGVIIINTGTETTCNSYFYDSGSNTDQYQNSENYTMTVYPVNPTDKVRVVFSVFETENNWDGLVIYDGNSSAAPMISSGLPVGSSTTNCPAGSFYGTTSPGTITSTATDGSLTFQFRSDGSGLYDGWEALFSCFTPEPPIANFVANDSTPIIDQVITLTDLTIHEPTSWQWHILPNNIGDFDYVNSTSAISQNPQINFNVAGTWDVALVATNALGEDSIMKLGYIVVTAPTDEPVAGFVASQLVASTNNDTITLQDTSLFTPTAWAWTITPNTFVFVNGTSATDQNPQVVFTTAGFYTVELIASNFAGDDTATSIDYIEVIPGYCLTNLGGSSSTTITEVIVANTTLNNIIHPDPILTNGSYQVSFPASGNTTGDLVQGASYDLTVTTSDASIISAWVDYDKNGIFEATEWVQVNFSSTADVPSVVSLSVPLNAALGTTGMRIRTRLATNTNGATDACSNFGSGVTEDYWINIVPPATPVAGFVADNFNPIIDQMVQFTDTSLNYPNNWIWSFDPITVTFVNGTDANSQNPQVQFNAAGLYKATLVAANATGSDTASYVDYIDVVLPTNEPIAYFYANDTTVTTTQIVSLIDTSDYTPTAWAWTITPSTFTFVNGTSAISQNPQVIFNQSGDYTVQMICANYLGDDTLIKTDYINVIAIFNMSDTTIYACDAGFYDPAGPSADYANSITKTTVIYPSTPGYKVQVQFTTFATENNYDGLMIYDGNSTSAPLISSGLLVGSNATTCPAGSYRGTTSPGTVVSTSTDGSLTFQFKTDGSGVDEGWAAQITCVPPPPPVTGFIADNLIPIIYQVVTLTDTSSNFPTSWAWTFNPNTVTYVNGTDATSQNPQVTFDAAGLYTVELTATNAAGSDVETKVDYIDVTEPTDAPVADFVADLTNVITGQTVSFTDLSTLIPTSWAWTITPADYIFVNGTDANSQNPQVQFTTNGLYTVQLTATNFAGSDDTIRVDYINVVSGFTITTDTITTCDALFFDNGGVNGDYATNSNDTCVIKPATVGNVVQLTFSMFDVEGWDVLKIYSGYGASAVLINSFTGNTLPPAITSTAANGGLTLIFSSNTFSDSAGWQAHISCVAPLVKSLTWSDTVFVENIANNGTIQTISTLQLTNDFFTVTSGALTEGVHFTATNVPAGLTAVVSATDNNTLTVQLTGTAINHAAADNVNNLGIEFLDVAFTNNSALDVVNSNRQDLSVNYYDPLVVPNIVITEIMYDSPESGQDSLEYIEIFNAGTTTVDISNYVFSSAVNYTVPAGTTMLAGDYYVICKNANAIFNKYGITAYAWQAASLLAGSETIKFKTFWGATVDSVAYSNALPWPIEAAAQGSSLALCNPYADNSVATAWTASQTATIYTINGKLLKGSPGSIDDACSPYDISIQFPTGDFDYCNGTGTDTFIVVILNSGVNPIATGEVITASYQVDGGTNVVENITLTESLVPGDTIIYIFNQTYNGSAVGVHYYNAGVLYSQDANNINDTISGTATHVQIDVVFNNGNGDTVIVTTAQIPVILQLNGIFDNYSWSNSDGSITGTGATLSVSTIGWFYVTVTNNNGCFDVDSIYVDIINGITGINGSSVNVYPNPSRDIFNIDLSGDYSGASIEIISAEGKVVYKNNMVSNNAVVNAKSMASGVYTLRIINQKQIIVKKLIVQ